MIRTFLAVLAIAALTFAACESGGGSDDPRDHEDELRQTVEDAYKSMFADGAAESYGYFSADFKERCSFEDFAGVITFVRLFLGEIDEEDIEVNVTEVRFEEDRAFVTVDGSINGEAIEGDEEDSSAVGEFWVYEEGEWKLGTDDEDPCSSSFGADSGDDATPASGPGSSRDDPAAIDEAMDIGDLRVTLLEADTDAGDQLEDLSDFPPTPSADRKVVLARVRVEHIGEESDDTIQVFESDFEVTGSANVIYDGFDNESSCGFIDDAVGGELFPGGSLEGYVCVQVPVSESSLLLIASPGFTFDEGRRFFDLESR